MTDCQPPLTEPVLQLLKNQLASLILSALSDSKDHSLTEQYLMSCLGLKLSTETEISPDLQRFQQHFVLYHLLYRLQTEWLATGEGLLDIGLAKVRFVSAASACPTALNVSKDNSSRREYYTNWQNFYAMSEQLLDEYLTQFWQHYSKGQVDPAQLSAQQAQHLLKLQPGFTLTDLKRAYRSQALLLHPDRSTGNAEKFRQIQQAYQQLLQQLP
ncbi:DNA-J related domain-containing protein [Arsukibacterium indicum]|uniref:DnaJ domain-containing protein n=1 Tax=Arsukibacterium indicum TaxID=2848612 RepID=A0ABS6MJ80_9GAMM|nr:DNA-J related domain-containing protein [Arsukibacterium indicum]MBV2128858.1 DnaJ domain-containing protein [Arsukibacterium indicum]